MAYYHRLRKWIKARQHPVARLLYRLAQSVRTAEMPMIRPIHWPLYHLFGFVSGTLSTILRVFWWTPLFQARLVAPARRLFLYGGMPLVISPLAISIGEGSRVSGQTTFTGRAASRDVPRLSIGSNVDIGWQTTIAVGRTIVIADNVRLAGRNFLAGYPGHPLDPDARAAGLPDNDDQVGNIVLEDGVWLATGVMVSAGVRIGKGTVVAAGSVVTHSLPAGVLAAGVPARVVRPLPTDADASAAAEPLVEPPVEPPVEPAA